MQHSKAGSVASRSSGTCLQDAVKRDYRINGLRSLPDVETRWREHLEPHFGRMRAVDVNAVVLNAYIDSRLQEGASRASINRELSALRRMFSLGRKQGQLRDVPVFTLLREDNVRTGFVADEDYKKLGAACSREGLWMRTLFETGYGVGWRVDELQGLRVNQVDLLNHTIRLEPGTTKNGRGRTAPIFASMEPWLQAAVHGKKSDAFVFSRGAAGAEPVVDFRGSWHKACCSVGLGQMLCKLCGEPIIAGKCSTHGPRTLKQQRFEGLLFHDLRRTAVRNMTRNGIPEKIAMTISGHQTRSVFDRYNIVSEGDLGIARERMREQSALHIPLHTEPEGAPSEVQQSKAVLNALPN